jgi:hypothetical protein
MGLREEIEAAFAEAAAEGGVRQLSVDGDEEVWVAGVAATDGTLEVRVGDRGPRHGLRRRRPDRTVMEAQGFRDSFHDAWVLPLPPGAGQAARGAAAAVSALVDGLGVAADARAEVFFTQRGAKDLVAAVEALSSADAEVAFVSPVGGDNALTLAAAGGDRIRVDVLWPGEGDEPLELPGFELDHDDRASVRTVERDEAVAAARAALAALGVGADDALFIHLGA